MDLDTKKARVKLPYEDRQATYRAVDRWIDEALRSDGSLFTPGRSIWALPWLEDLRHRFIENPDQSSDRFERKLERQLVGAPPEAIQLMAEVTYVHLLVASSKSMKGDTKRALVNSILSWLPDDVSIPDDLAVALDQGFASTGTAFFTYRPYQVSVIIQLAESWKRLTEEERNEALADPWAFKHLVTAAKAKGANAQQEALLHFVHPDTFEPIVALEHKGQIADAFSDVVPDSVTDLDEQILVARQNLAASYGEDFSWYQPEIRSQWQKADEPAVDPPAPEDQPSAVGRVWWVNQGGTYAHERRGGYIWAPQRTKAGTTVIHHANVAETADGDIVIHYANGAIRALGVVTRGGFESDRPDELPDDAWSEAGYRADVVYSELAEPVGLGEIPEGERVAEAGPFNRTGGVNQGYLYPVSSPFADRLRTQFGDRWPEDSPWHNTSRSPLRALAVYVGNAAMANLQFGLDEGVWGWRGTHPDYQEVAKGDILIFGAGYTGGSPRTQSADFAAHGLNRVIQCRIAGDLVEESDPLWPDERQTEKLIYSYRLKVEDPQELGAKTVAEINDHFGADVGEALRLSASSGGRGVMVELAGLRPEPEIDVSAVSLSDVCSAFEVALRVSGLDYGQRHEALVRSFVASLATKRLALLTGLSGSGKTRLALAFGQWLGPDRYSVVPVRPDWTGPDALLGYENQLSVNRGGLYSWVVPETLEFMLRASRDPRHPYLLLLDEMNLAHVERYFADVLSGMESDELILPNLIEQDGEWRQLAAKKVGFPPNLFVVGTVNIDETTYMFSPKVLDRANTLEFRVLTEDLNGGGSSLVRVEAGDDQLTGRFLYDATNAQALDGWDGRSKMAEALTELHQILAEIDREFGHRVFQEALRFGSLLAQAGEDDWMTALDLQVMQKVLPRFHGSVKQVTDPLRILGNWSFSGPGSKVGKDFDPLQPPDGEPALPVTFDKVSRMYRRVLANHFVSFAE